MGEFLHVGDGQSFVFWAEQIYNLVISSLIE